MFNNQIHGMALRIIHEQTESTLLELSQKDTAVTNEELAFILSQMYQIKHLTLFLCWEFSSKKDNNTFSKPGLLFVSNGS